MHGGQVLIYLLNVTELFLMHAFSDNILLTGATGFLGFRTMEQLLKLRGDGMIIASGRTIKPAAYINHKRVNYLLGDLADRSYVASLFDGNKIQKIIHCAALSAPWGSEEAFYRANVLAQKHLIAEAKTRDIERFVFISTPTIYVNYKDRLNVRESAPLPKTFVNAYSQTKREAERLLEGSGLSWITLRPRALIGRGDTVIIPRILRAYYEKRLRIIGNGKNMVDLTPVQNVVYAILLALSADEVACSRIYNISNGNPVSLWAAISYALEKMGLHPPTQKLPFPLAYALAWGMELYAKTFQANKEPTFTRYTVASLAKSLTLDISLAREYLGYQPEQSVQEGIDEFVAWFKSKGKL